MRKVTQLLKPSPSDSKAASFPATWSLGGFPRETRSWVFGEASGGQGEYSRLPLVHGEDWLSPSSSERLRPHPQAPLSRGFPPRVGPGAPSARSTEGPAGLCAGVRGARQALSAAVCGGRPDAALGSSRWTKSGTRSRGHDRGNREERSENGSGCLRWPVRRVRPLTVAQTFSRALHRFLPQSPGNPEGGDARAAAWSPPAAPKTRSYPRGARAALRRGEGRGGQAARHSPPAGPHVKPGSLPSLPQVLSPNRRTAAAARVKDVQGRCWAAERGGGRWGWSQGALGLRGLSGSPAQEALTCLDIPLPAPLKARAWRRSVGATSPQQQNLGVAGARILRPPGSRSREFGLSFPSSRGFPSYSESSQRSLEADSIRSLS